ncbi:pentapeptide MXKDX repeat protein [Cupriavidus pauculus]|uniref:Pentapeptide MXKDX repeat protein n=1 Tax=Cupriavidus pauculus TaxID=82633 RepID=A0A2N5CB32_9BURK|nr:pentapeptide MXKDX repeat protein [Cupriavidus pauculus]PLP99427.1 pentapeptide MXKDX repeat protein [Cupriavidus pauculus]
MNKTVVAVVATMFLMGGTAVFAQTGGSMAKDTMSKDSMSKDAMSKDAMAKDAMSKDGMAKDNMSKDGMSKDKMGKSKPHDKMGKEGDAMSGGMSK